MTKYCGETRNVSGTIGGGYMATGQLEPNDPRSETMSVALGSVVSIATELSVLQSPRRSASIAGMSGSGLA